MIGARKEGRVDFFALPGLTEEIEPDVVAFYGPTNLCWHSLLALIQDNSGLIIVFTMKTSITKYFGAYLHK